MQESPTQLLSTNLDKFKDFRLKVNLNYADNKSESNNKDTLIRAQTSIKINE